MEESKGQGMSKCRYDLSEDCNNIDCLTCVLDKIRTEIEQFAENPNFGDLSLGASCGAMKAIEIINKYKAESEG